MTLWDEREHSGFSPISYSQMKALHGSWWSCMRCWVLLRDWCLLCALPLFLRLLHHYSDASPVGHRPEQLVSSSGELPCNGTTPASSWLIQVWATDPNTICFFHVFVLFLSVDAFCHPYCVVGWWVRVFRLLLSGMWRVNLTRLQRGFHCSTCCLLSVFLLKSTHIY